MHSRSRKIASLLLQRGASIDHRDASGRTVLHWILYNGKCRTLRWLLRHGADTRIVDSDGTCVIPLCMRLGRLVRACVCACMFISVLFRIARLTRRPLVPALGRRGRQCGLPVGPASRRPSMPAAIRGSSHQMAILNIADNDGVTSLARACQLGRPVLVSLLLARHALTAPPSRLGATALHAAAAQVTAPSVVLSEMLLIQCLSPPSPPVIWPSHACTSRPYHSY
jgi:ankyrin repeat protein